MTPRLRRSSLLVHVATSVGWLGAVAAYLALAVVALTTDDAQRARAAYLCLDVIGWSVLVPLSLASLASGLLHALATEWGLFRHWWIVAKSALAVVGTAILLGHMRRVGEVADLTSRATFPAVDLGAAPQQLVVHAAGGLLLLLVATGLSVFKPWGRTPWGARARPARPAP